MSHSSSHPPHVHSTLRRLEHREPMQIPIEQEFTRFEFVLLAAAARARHAIAAPAWSASLGSCFHSLQGAKRIEWADGDQFETHEMGLAQRQLLEHVMSGGGVRDIQDEHHAP